MSKLTRIEEAKDPECFLFILFIYEEDWTIKMFTTNSKYFEAKF